MQIFKWVKKFLFTIFISQLAWSIDAKHVEEIHVLGLKKITQDAVTSKINTKPGEMLQPEKIKSDIQAIFNTGYFEDISAFFEEVHPYGIKVIFKVVERPVIQKVICEGNENFQLSDFKEVIKTKNHDILDVTKVKADVVALQKFYEEKGFYIAKVHFEVQKASDKPDEVIVVFKIREFDKLIIKKIQFLNNQVFSQNTLKRTFRFTQEDQPFAFLSGAGQFKENAFKQDLQLLSLWYFNHGYIKFRIDEPVITISDDKRFLYISIHVSEGESYFQGKIEFSGDVLFPQSELLEKCTLTPGEVFNLSKHQADILALQELLQDLGYAFANVTPRMMVNENTKTVDINFEFQKGDLVHFRYIQVAGNDKTWDRVIRRELRIYEGELYSGSKLRISKENVERLGFFAPNEVFFNTVAVKDRPDMLDVIIHIKERSTGTLNVGFGWGSMQGITLSANASEQNLFGRGQSLSLSAQYTLDRFNRSINLGFFDPYAFDTLWNAGFDFYILQFAIPSRYTAIKQGFDVKIGYPVFEYANLLFTYRLEHNRDINTQSDVPEWVIQADSGYLSSLSAQLVRDKRNNRLETTHGNYQSLSVEYAGLGGDMKFLKWILNTRLYVKVIGDLVFRNNFQLGHMIQTTDRTLPPVHKFYLGGRDMKGFQLFQLGPSIVNADGSFQPMGGTFMGFSVFELQYPLLKELSLKGFLFFDVGNNWSTVPFTQPGDAFTIRADYGFGLRALLPFAPIQLTWGFPVKPLTNENPGPVFHIFIEPPF